MAKSILHYTERKKISVMSVPGNSFLMKVNKDSILDI